ncbi:SRPBCC family protein [Thalassoglobus sp. JC818]|uniref:SRPBCC family protein n=1 Tax=Thalassoglobus sp. JC818 TaxID=3232136 RepID=UPI00345A08D5
MLIRKPVEDVFEAISNPEITTRFWFSRSSGKLAPEKKVRWDWEMFGVGDTLTVKEYEENSRLLIEWESDPTIVEWRFEPRDDASTLVTISNWGFTGTCEEVLPQAVDSKGGYTMVLAGMKAWLEFGIELNLVRDQFPDGCSA